MLFGARTFASLAAHLLSAVCQSPSHSPAWTDSLCSAPRFATQPPALDGTGWVCRVSWQISWLTRARRTDGRIAVTTKHDVTTKLFSYSVGPTPNQIEQIIWIIEIRQVSCRSIKLLTAIWREKSRFTRLIGILLLMWFSDWHQITSNKLWIHPEYYCFWLLISSPE